MIKHIIAAIATILALLAIVYMVNLDKEVNKLENISNLIKSTAMEDSKLSSNSNKAIKETQVVDVERKSEDSSSKDKEIEQKLKSLREKAGNIAAFNTSPLYKKSCASCHGNIGEGIIGPKLLGKNEAYIYKALRDFKSGERKNYVMYGLLGNMSDEELKDLSKEISTFKEKLEEATK